MLLSNGLYRPIAPQAFSETAPQFYESYFAPRTGIQLATTVATYGLMYRVQPHLFSAINKIATLIARLQVQVWDTTSDDGDAVDRSGPYAKLMKSPCFIVDTYKFYDWVGRTVEIYGEAYLLKNRVPREDGKGPIKAFIPMHPAVTQIHRDDNGSLLYGFMSAPNMWFPESEVVPFRTYNPDNTMRGLSRMEPLRQTLMNEDSARRAMRAWWDNMGRPGYVLSSPKKLSDKAKRHLIEGVQGSVGGADNAGGVMLLEDDVTATRMQLDAEEMQYIESRKLNRDECFEVYDINPAAAQINDHTTQTSYTPMTKDVYKASIDYRLQFMQSVFDFYVGSEFYGPKEARFDVSQQLRSDIETLAPAIVQLIQTGALKPVEARKWLGLSEGGDEAKFLYANANLQRLGQIGAIMTRYQEMGEVQPPLEQGEKPINPNATNTQSPVATGDLPKTLPEMTEKAKLYKGAIFSGLGRGQTWDQIALKLMERNPADRQDIQVACLDILMGV